MRTLLLGSAAVLALDVPAVAQSSALPPVTVDAPQGSATNTRGDIATPGSHDPSQCASEDCANIKERRQNPGAASATAGRQDPRDQVFATNQSTATKTSTPVLETPQSISTVTRKQIDEQNPQTVGNALRYTAGVLSEVDATTRYDSVFLRGIGGFGTSQFRQFS